MRLYRSGTRFRLRQSFVGKLPHKLFGSQSSIYFRVIYCPAMRALATFDLVEAESTDLVIAGTWEEKEFILSSHLIAAQGTGVEVVTRLFAHLRSGSL